MRVSQSVKDAIDAVLGWVASVMMLIVTLFALLEIVRRYAFGVVFEWGQDALIVGMIAAVSFYFCVTQIRRGHLVMNAVVLVMQKRGYYRTVGLLKIAVSAIIAIFCGSLAITGWPSLSYVIERNVSTYSLIIPLWPSYLILIFGFGLMAFVALLQTVEDVVSYVRGEHFSSDIELTTEI